MFTNKISIEVTNEGNHDKQNDAGQRLDKFLTKYLVNMPQSMLYKSLRKNCVRVNGKHIKDGKYMLQNGDVLKLFFKDEFYESKSSLNQAIRY